MDNEIKGTLFAAALSTCVLALTFWLAQSLRGSTTSGPERGAARPNGATMGAAVVSPRADGGRDLFARNCAHCHGDDARGDEGPTLHNLAMSDARIAKRIKEGIKGEMPKFGSKLNDTDIAALIAYLRTLKN